MNSIIKKILRPIKNSVVELVNHYDDKAHLQWYFRYSKRLLRFKDIHKGESCFIIGNGPSLNKMDLSPLKNYHTFGLNKIYLMKERVDLNLSYHVAVNPLVILQSVTEFEALSCPTFLSYRSAHNIIKDLNHVNFLSTNGSYLFQTDLRKQMDEGCTVTYVAMQIAYYMGFTTVFLIGVDHNFTTNGNPNEQQLLQGSDINHFHPNYFSNNEWHLPDLEGSELAYYMARFFFHRNGRKIYDATIDGKLRIFPKISFEEALDICGKKRL